MDEDYAMKLLAAQKAAERYEQIKNTPASREGLRKQMMEDPTIPFDRKPGTLRGEEDFRRRERNILNTLTQQTYNQMMVDRQKRKLRDEEEMRQLGLARARKEMMSLQE
jgi:hypothetical protein